MMFLLDKLWLLNVIALLIAGALLAYLGVNRHWRAALNLRLIVFLGLLFTTNLALLISLGRWIDPVQNFFLRLNLYTQVGLSLAFFALGWAFLLIERKPWGILAGLLVLLGLIGVDVAQVTIPAFNGSLASTTIVLFLRAWIWLAVYGFLAILGTQEYRHATSPLHRNRLAYLALAASLLFIGDALDMILTTPLRSLSAAFQIAGAATIAYAALRHALFDLRTLLRQTIYYLVLTLFTIIVYLLVIENVLSVFNSAEPWQRWLGAFLSAIVLTFIYQPVYDWLRGKIRLIVFGKHYDAQSVVQNFSQRLGARIDIAELAQEGHGLLEQAMGASNVALLLVSRDDRGYVLRLVSNQPNVLEIHLAAALSLANMLATRGKPLLQYDIDRLPHYADVTPETRAALQKLGGEVYVPILSRGALIGIWVIGTKISGDRYSDTDLALLSTLADQSAVALENARLLADLRDQVLQMRSMRDYLDSTMASLATGVLTLDRGNKIISFNRAAEEIFRVPAVTAIGQSYETILPPLEGAQLPLLISRLWAQSAQHLVRDAVTQVVGRGAVHLTVHLSAMRRSDDMVGIAIVIEDLTDQARLEQDRRAQEQETKRVRTTFEHYVAPTVVEGLLSDPRRIALGGERQLVTILFADIHGFTTLSEKLPPEELVQILNGYLSLAAQTVLHYEGTLDKFLGDGVMAIFNAPLPQTDHALRAVRAALALQREVAAYAPQLPKAYRLNFRIGLHTGEAVVGNIGTRDLMNYTAIGDTVNTAKRLQENAGENQIYMSRTTFDLVSDHVVVRDCEKLTVKGRKTPVEVFELTSVWE